MRTPGVSLSDDLVELIDDRRGEAGALNRSEFIRVAVVHYLRDELDVDVDEEARDIRAR